MTNIKKSQKKSTIESLMSELKEISDKLESRDVSIDDSIELCERGNELIQLCNKQINEIKLKIADFDSKNSDEN